MSKNLLLAILLAYCLHPHGAFAAESEWAVAEQTRARLITALDNAGGRKQFEGGLDIQLGEGWHTYWKMPGDSGLPPRFEWKGSDNIEGVDVLYPSPERKDEAGLQVFGYTDKVFFPLDIKLIDVTKPAKLDLELGIMVCHEICVPQNLHLALSIENSGKEVGNISHKSLIAAEKRKVPDQEDSVDLKTTTTVTSKDALALGIYSKAGFDHADFWAYTDDLYFTATPKIEVDAKDKTRAIISMPKPDGTEDLNKALSGKKLHIYFTNGRKALEKEIGF